jgi:hypothetical protein
MALKTHAFESYEFTDDLQTTFCGELIEYVQIAMDTNPTCETCHAQQSNSRSRTGLCTECGVNPPFPNYWRCDACLTKTRPKWREEDLEKHTPETADVPIVFHVPAVSDSERVFLQRECAYIALQAVGGDEHFITKSWTENGRTSIGAYFPYTEDALLYQSKLDERLGVKRRVN